MTPDHRLSCEHLTEGGGRAPPVSHLPVPQKPALTLSWRRPLCEALQSWESTFSAQYTRCPERGDLALGHLGG